MFEELPEGAELTLEQFERIPYGAVFATGILPNSEDGLYMEASLPSNDLRWVATKGSGPDWAIYCHWATNDANWVKEHGDKIRFQHHILKCVNCSKQVLTRYRF